MVLAFGSLLGRDDPDAEPPLERPETLLGL